MFITSMGIFGFLSKAHIDQTILTGDNSLLITQIDQRIERQERNIKDAEKVIETLDAQVDTLIEYDRIRGPQGALATRQNQKPEREQLNNIINESFKIINDLQNEKLTLEKGQLELEAEVGPIKYIAEFVYGEKADKTLLEEAVRWVIVIIVAVFDPLAVALLVAWNDLQMRIRPVPPIVRTPNPPPRPKPKPKPDIPNEAEQEQMSKKGYVWDSATLSYKRIKAGATT